MKQSLSLSILLLIFASTFCTYAYAIPKVPNGGVQWIEGQSWKEVQAKAIKEKKYIFLDAYATWCSPCKKMDKETYPDAKTGSFFSKHFISVKVQMDKTKNDDEIVKSWYEDAAFIMKKYRVQAYPTLLFLTPDGNLIHKIIGFKDAAQLMEAGSIALRPGQRYTDPNEAFYTMQEEYNSGVKNYAQMPFLFKKATELGEGGFAKSISKEYRDYLNTQKEADLYTPRNLEFITSHAISSKSSFFRLFYPDGSKADAVMQKKGYAENIVDQVILREITEPMLGFKSGGMLRVGGQTDSSEADWKALHAAIDQNYNAAYAKRNVLNAQLLWYARKRNTPKYDETLRLALETYGIDTVNAQGERSLRAINGHMWNIFTTSSDTHHLNYAAKWMKRVVEASINDRYHPIFMDSYANILYKLGKTQDAIAWEEKSVQILREKGHTAYLKQYEVVLANMKAGIPTWKPIK